METLGAHSMPKTIPKDILDDLSSRFIINVPEEERKDVVRICFQIELAHWFYLDYYCPEDSLLRQCGIKEFARIIFNHVPSLKEHADRVDDILVQWKEYKMAVPTFGAIMLDGAVENVLLVQSYFAKASWGFPKGKVNEEEEPHNCAVREVLEETGFDIGKLIRKDNFIEVHIHDQIVRLYIVVDVPKDFHFKPKTKNEIKEIRWFPVNGLPSSKKDINCKSTTGFGPNAFFMVIPFVRHIRKWIASHQQKKSQPTGSGVVGCGRRHRSKTTGDVNMLLNSIAATETARRQQQQQQFTSVSQLTYAEYIKGTKEAAKLLTYSPPPRMLKQKAQKSENPKRATQQSPASRAAKPEFSSQIWTNFRFDRGPLLDSFNWMPI